MKLGDTIVALRKQRGLMQSELAERSDLSVPYLSLIENDRKAPSTSALESIAEALGISLPVLFFLAMDEKDVPPEKRASFEAVGRTFQEYFREMVVSEDVDQ